MTLCRCGSPLGKDFWPRCQPEVLVLSPLGEKYQTHGRMTPLMWKIRPLARRIAQPVHNSDVSLLVFARQIGNIRFGLHRASGATTPEEKILSTQTRIYPCLAPKAASRKHPTCERPALLGFWTSLRSSHGTRTISMTAPYQKPRRAGQMSHLLGPLV